MKHFLAVLISLFVFTSTVCAYPYAADYTESDEAVTFIVEVEGEPSLYDISTQSDEEVRIKTDHLLSEQARVLSNMQKRLHTTTDKGFVYTALFNGFSVEGTASQIDEIKSLDGVKNVYISENIPVPKPQLSQSGILTDVQTAYDSEFTGKGQVIAVIDEYCDTAHAFFAEAPQNPKYSKEDMDALLKTKKLNSGSASANQVYKNEKIPYAYDYTAGSADTYSQSATHGTHVTGIAAGKNGKMPDGSLFSGVAYNAQVLFMNASKDGYLTSDAIFAAINDAALLGADVINMSFGSDYVDSSIAVAYGKMIDAARNCGISIVTSAGNNARGYDSRTPLASHPDYSSLGQPACVEPITAVASADNTKTTIYAWKMMLKNGTEFYAYLPYSNSVSGDLLKDFCPYVYCGLGYESDFQGKDLNGKIALLTRGELTFVEKAQRAKQAGAIGMVLINTSDQPYSLSGLALPVVCISQTDGNKLINDTDGLLKFISGDNRVVANVGSGRISSYSAWGVDSSLQLKPEITAPGGNIYSSVPDNRYTSMSGTSMSSPYMAGVLALAREYYETNPYQANFNGYNRADLVKLLENISMNTAEIIRYENGVPYSPRVQGAGMVNLGNLLNGKVMLCGDFGKAKVSLGEITSTFQVPFTITNISKETVTFSDISVELVADGSLESEGKNYVDASVRVPTTSVSMPEEVTVLSGETYSFSAEISVDRAFLQQQEKIFTNGFFIDGFVILNNPTEEYGASIPFTGFYGDWFSQPVFDTTVYDLGGSTLADVESPYNTGTYLKMYIDDSRYYFVGRNLADETIADEKYISFSNMQDLTFGFSAKTYRTASNLQFAIFDKNDACVYSDRSQDGFNKFRIFHYRFKNAQMEKIPEGEYTLQVDAITEGSNEICDTLEFPLVIDNTAPNILSAVYNAEERTVTVSAKDNHYVSFIYLEFDDDYQYIAVTDADTSDGVVTKTIDLSGVKDIESVEIEICDYALNSAYARLSSLTDKIGVDLVHLYLLDDFSSAQFEIRNNTDTDLKTDIYVAFYDSEGKLLAVTQKNEYKMVSGVTQALSCSVGENAQSVAKVQMFLWEPSSIVPIDTNKLFSLTENN